MSNRLLTLFFFATFFTITDMTAQEWVRTFPFPTENFSASFAAVAPDGGVMVTDTRRGIDSLLVAKIMASGTIVWESLLPKAGLSNANNPLGCGGIYFNPDGSMYLLNNTGTPIYDLILVDENGSEESRVSNTSFGFIMRTVRLGNGDFVVTKSPGAGLQQITPDGTVVYTSNPGMGAGINFTNTIALADNGHYLMYVNGFFNSGTNGVVIHADELGQQVDIYNMPYTSFSNSIAKGVDGNFMVVGSNDSLFWVNMTVDGTYLNQKVLDDPALQLISRDIVALPDGYLVAGSKGGNAAIWRLDLAGNLANEQVLLPGYEAVFTSLTAEEGSYTVYGSGSLRQLSSNQSDVFVLKLNFSPLQDYGKITGTVRLDPQGDCSADLSETGISLMPVQAANAMDTIYTLTDSSGGYQFFLETGDYAVTPIDIHPYLENCGPAQQVTVTGNDTSIVDFWAKELYDCPLLQVNLSNGLMRRCFQNYYAVSYCNTGTATALDAYIEIILDPNLVYSSSTIPLSSSSGDTLIFDLGDLDVGTCGYFNLFFEMMDCNELELGQSICSSAHIYPDTVCGDYSGWSGASMKVGALCETDVVKLFVTNVGTAPTSQPIGFIVTEDNVILLQGGDFFNPTDTTWSIRPANGSTWRMESGQEPQHPGFSFPSVTVEGCGANASGGFSTGFLPTLPLDDADFAHDIECRPVIAAFDPNEKEAFPTGVAEEHFIVKNSDIEYLLRFQNTGNDTAFTVVLRDTLPTEMNPASVQMGAGSHPFTWTLEGRGVLVVRFDQILLPDSTTNEAASHGWVKFRISQKENLPLGTVIENSVAIYFDFNDPVITNTTFHTLGENFLEIINDVKDVPEGFGQLLAYPNPSASEVTFELSTDKTANANFLLFNQIGRQVAKGNFNENKYRFQRNGLAAGVYFYKVEMEGAGVYSGKIILK